MVLFGSVKTQNGQPVMTVLDLRPNENGFLLIDMQKVNRAYTKKNPANFVADSEVMYADVKRTTSLLRGVGFVRPASLLRSGSMGSITYRGNTVNLQGEKFSSVVEFSDSDERFSMRLPVEETEKLVQENSGSAAAEEADSEGRALTAEQAEFFKDSKVRVDEDGEYWYGEGSLLPVYHATYDDFTVFDREKLGANTDGNASDEAMEATAHIGFWFNSQDLTGEAGDRAVKAYLNIAKPYDAGTLDGLASDIIDHSDAENASEMGQDFVDWLSAQGYDGVKLEDSEFGGMSFIALDSSQIKNVSNQSPTNDPDIRFSRRGDQAAGAVSTDTLEQARAEARALQQENDRLKERLEKAKGQVKRTTAAQRGVRSEDTRRLARSLVKEYDSQADVQTVADSLKALGDYLVREDSVAFTLEIEVS